MCVCKENEDLDVYVRERGSMCVCERKRSSMWVKWLNRFDGFEMI